MRRLLIVAATTLILASCQASREPLYETLPKNTTPYKLSAGDISKLKSWVARDLKDPESARFEPLFVAATDGQKLHICGYVNGKNSYGGYTGIKPFYAVGTADATYFGVASMGNDEFEADLTFDMCRRVGAPLEHDAASRASR